jgi:hypothetical protein
VLPEILLSGTTSLAQNVPSGFTSLMGIPHLGRARPTTRTEKMRRLAVNYVMYGYATRSQRGTECERQSKATSNALSTTPICRGDKTGRDVVAAGSVRDPSCAHMHHVSI